MKRIVETKVVIEDDFLLKTRILIDFFRTSSEDMDEEELQRIKPTFQKVKIGIKIFLKFFFISLIKFCSFPRIKNRNGSSIK